MKIQFICNIFCLGLVFSSTRTQRLWPSWWRTCHWPMMASSCCWRRRLAMPPTGEERKSCLSRRPSRTTVPGNTTPSRVVSAQKTSPGRRCCPKLSYWTMLELTLLPFTPLLLDFVAIEEEWGGAWGCCFSAGLDQWEHRGWLTVQSVAWVCGFELFYVIVLFNFCATAVVTVHVGGGYTFLHFQG